MASFAKFNAFVADVSNKVHNLSSDQLTIALTNTIPVATNSVIANITQVSYTNISSRNLTTTSSTQSSGTYKLIVGNPTFTASGSVGPFQYLVLYNSTASGGPLIGWYDFGSAVTLTSGDVFTITFDSTNGVISIT